MSDRIERFAEVLLARLAPRARVLEIGCGSGELATLLAAKGYEVTAIDRNPRAEFPVTPQSFETFDSRGKAFDCAIAMLVLHHAADLEATVAKMADVLAPEGIVAIDDYGWERLDDDSPEATAWRKDREDLHTSASMLAALDRAFERTHYHDHAYLDDGRGSDRIAFTYVGTRRS